MTHVVFGGGYCVRGLPTPGLLHLHLFRTCKARYRSLGPHTVITASPRIARIAWNAVHSTRADHRKF